VSCLAGTYDELTFAWPKRKDVAWYEEDDVIATIIVTEQPRTIVLEDAELKRIDGLFVSRV
jgi:hypothetical protein